MVDKEGNVLPDIAVLGINAIPLMGRLEICLPNVRVLVDIHAHYNISTSTK